MSVFPVFISNTISFEHTGSDKGDDYHYVRATRDIKQGDLLLVEHCYSAPSFHNLVAVIQVTPLLFNELCPRTITWESSFALQDSEKMRSLCIEKATHNAFGHDGRHLIGVHATKFNHSAEPNATVKFLRCRLTDLDMFCDFIYFYANKDILAGQEICTWYGNQFFGDGKTFDDPFHSYTSYNHIAQQYLSTPACKNIIVEHVCCHRGLFLVDDTFLTTPAFLEFFKIAVGREPSVENIQKWILDLMTLLDSFFRK
jgi:hypothetical protein